jgi:hypothetical protein
VVRVLSDAELLAQAASLRAEAGAVLAAADLPAAFAGLGPVQVIGSYRSGLMVWRDIDVMLTAPAATATAVLAGVAGLAAGGRLVSADFRDERGPRRPTPSPQDERYYVVCRYDWPAGLWKIDITVWLHAVDRPHVAFAEHLAVDLSAEQRLAILRIKQVWHRRPDYPEQVSGMDVYTAVLDDGVGTPAEFAAWLAARDRPTPPDP